MKKKSLIKKIFVLACFAVLSLLLLCGCKKNNNGGNSGNNTSGQSQGTSSTTSASFDPSLIPEFNGEDYVAEINDNKTFFTDDELLTEYETSLSELDDLGRAHVAWMCADEEHIQTGERESIYKLKPAGWHGGGFYERSHLLMWKLSGINDLRNLVTGTATFNEFNMQDYEKKVTAYLWDNEYNHVMYRVTPVYNSDELLCRGVLMEAKSVEDDGDLEYCVFVYNAEPGVTIDYRTGDFAYTER